MAVWFIALAELDSERMWPPLQNGRLRFENQMAKLTSLDILKPQVAWQGDGPVRVRFALQASSQEDAKAAVERILDMRAIAARIGRPPRRIRVLEVLKVHRVGGDDQS